ncbi:hypothetical protein [Paenibacillus sp. Z3-2]
MDNYTRVINAQEYVVIDEEGTSCGVETRYPIAGMDKNMFLFPIRDISNRYFAVFH